MFMTHLSLPCISFGITALLAGSAVTLVRPAAGRRPAIISALVSLLAFALAALEVHHQHGARLLDAWVPWLEADALDAVPMVFFASLTLVLITLAPRRDAGGSALSGMLLLAAATEIAYAASNLITLATGWWLTAVPFAFRFFGNPPARRVV